MSKFINYCKESYKELVKKVTWPAWAKLQNSAGLVVVATFVIAVMLFIMDYAFQNLMAAIYTL